MQNSLISQSNFQPGLGEVIGGVATIKGFERIFANVVSVTLGLAGIALFIMLIMGGA